MSEAKVSVIVPIYNVGKYVKKCIDSIINQSYENIEIILVDDGSDDGSNSIVDEYGLTDHRIKVVHKENGGLVSARKAGLLEATGEYIAYVDGDDWIDDSHIENMVEDAECEDADIVITGCKYYKENGEITKVFNSIPSGIYDKGMIENFIVPHMLNLNAGSFSFGLMPYLWNKLIRRELLIQHQSKVPDDISTGEDVMCSYPCVIHAKRLLITSQNTYCYRVLSNSMSHSKEGLAHVLRRHQALVDIMSSEEIYDRWLKTQVKYYYAWNLLGSEFWVDLFDKNKTRFFAYNVNRGEKIVIYGFGKRGKRLAEILTDFCTIVAFSDRNAYGVKEVNGYPVVPVSEICKLQFDKIVLSVSSPYDSAIVRNFNGLGINENQVVGKASVKEIAEVLPIIEERLRLVADGR